ncbi:MAG: threonine aldolase family protein [Hyphomicrobiales bacterium]
MATTYVDLRSDTVTRPTGGMRLAMAEAEVGDDVFHDDPTVRLLEEETAAVLGKEAALFVPTGCMGNECAIAVQTREGDAILLERRSHPITVEARAVTELLRRRFVPLDADRGLLDPAEVVRALERGDAPAGAAGPEGRDGEARIALVEAECTHNAASGAIYPLPRLQAIGKAARDHGRPLHLDGARLWNASAATGVPVADYAACADTVMVCYSKGLGAPLGSAIAGRMDAIEAARDVRRAFGGAMRQVGIVAAGALYGLRHHRARLAEDHRRARRLAEGIAAIPGLAIDPGTIETNIVIAEVTGDPARVKTFAAALEADGVLVIPFGGPGRFRAVTHLDLDDDAIERALAAMRAAAGAIAA